MSRRAARATAIDPLAEPLHRNALRLLRQLRREDRAAGVSAARLSALSLLVFGGPATVGAIAAAEQVSAPTMTRLAQAMEREGWVRRQGDPGDARVVRLAATPAAVRLLHEGRDRRLLALSAALAQMSAGDRAVLARAARPLGHLVDLLGARSSRQPAPGHSRRGRRRPE